MNLKEKIEKRRELGVARFKEMLLDSANISMSAVRYYSWNIPLGGLSWLKSSGLEYFLEEKDDIYQIKLKYDNPEGFQLELEESSKDFVRYIENSVNRALENNKHTVEIRHWDRENVRAYLTSEGINYIEEGRSLKIVL